jgi:hypothetical protein
MEEAVQRRGAECHVRKPLILPLVERVRCFWGLRVSTKDALEPKKKNFRTVM